MSKTPWASFKKEFKKQFPRLRFQTFPVSLFLIFLFFYFQHLQTNFFAPPIRVFSLTFAQEEPPLSAVPVGNSQEALVLTYHYIQEVKVPDVMTQALSVSPQTFENQLLALKSQGHQFISLSQLEVGLQQGLPEQAIALTFDDGYEDFYLHAYPILTRNQIPAALFVSNGLLDRFQYLKTSQLLRLNQDPLITIAGHTLHHPDLTLSSLQSARDEILNGKKKLEELVGKEVVYFAYPYGTYTDRVIALVKEAGFRMAFTTQGGKVQQGDNLLLLKRVSVREESF
jgi:peptidoglycan/xylan/chitin deacetylase (PgdA/CDA1 family)